MQRLQTLTTTNWQENFIAQTQTEAITGLESGQVLFLPNLSFALSNEEKKILSPKYLDPKRKNISWQPSTQILGGLQADTSEQELFKNMLSRFANYATNLITGLFPRYTKNLAIARTSYRPAEISVRKISYRKDDTRLHVDAFPSSPNQGRRILRVFSNINPVQADRVWRLGESFETVAKHFLPKISKPFPGTSHVLNYLGITKSYRTLYDHYMLQIHDRMKGDLAYQKAADQIEMCFPANSSWIVQTDQVSHAAMSGQYMLEQTFYLPVHAMQNEQQAPLRILEKLTNKKLV
jgi:hypothetical protein